MEHYEKEIQRLQASMDGMRRKLEDFELRDSNNDLASNSSTHSDTKMRSIISRYVGKLNFNFKRRKLIKNCILQINYNGGGIAKGAAEDVLGIVAQAEGDRGTGTTDCGIGCG